MFEERLQKLIDGITAMQDSEGVNAAKAIWENEGTPRIKFARIAIVGLRRDETTGEMVRDHRCSAYCFVAFEDGNNKHLGSYRKGDVFRSDGWKRPARHARGNIFADDNGLKCCGRYGVVYLR